MSNEVIIALVGAIGLIFGSGIAALPGLIGPLINRKDEVAQKQAQTEKLKAEEDRIKTEIENAVWRRAKEQIDFLGASLKATNNEVERLRAERDECKTQILDIVGRFKELVSELNKERTQRQKLAKDLELEKAKRSEYRIGVLILIQQLRDMNIEPKWKPTENGIS